MSRLKEKGRIFREAFLAKLGLLLRGTVAAPPERYGETLADEHIRGGRTVTCTQAATCNSIIVYIYNTFMKQGAQAQHSLFVVNTVVSRTVQHSMHFRNRQVVLQCCFRAIMVNSEST